MQKTAAEMRDKLKQAQREEKQRLNDLKTRQDKEPYLLQLYEKRKKLIEQINERRKVRESIAKRGTQFAHKRM